ncbi:hypothetical protein [Nocardia rhizosphaerae]|uniref:Uncharacterized protein n=1 Tax=Nocardia rhizosphaerae TaxID=1691571 RepID=A0ABV8L1K8_9NOCA
MRDRRGPEPVFADPSVRVTGPDGSFVAEWPIPENERMRADSGPQRTQVIALALR